MSEEEYNQYFDIMITDQRNYFTRLEVWVVLLTRPAILVRWSSPKFPAQNLLEKAAASLDDDEDLFDSASSPEA